MRNSKKDRIESAIAEMISSGIVKPGQKVPSLRKTSQLYNVSVTPVAEAYKELEKLGILQGRPKSGYVVVSNDLSALSFLGKGAGGSKSASATNAADSSYLPSGDYLYNFDRPSIAPGLFSGADAAYHISRNLKLFPNLVDIEPAGYDDHALTDALSKFMLSYNLVCHSDDIAICDNDILSAFQMTLQCCTEPGDTIILTSPCAKIHIQAAAARGHRILCVHSYPGTGIDLDELEHCLITNPEAKCLLLSTCNQFPAGSRMPDEAKERLATICCMHQLTVIEDDCFGHLNFDGKRPKPLKGYAPDNVIYLSSLTSALLPGLRLNWACPGKYKAAFLRCRNQAAAAPVALLQNGIASMINSRQFRKKLDALNQKLSEELSVVMNALFRSFPEHTAISMPKGGIGIWVQLPRNMNAERLKEEARLDGIYIATGDEFSACGGYADCFAINFSVIAANPEMLKGVLRLGEIASRLCEEEFPHV